MPLRPSSKMNGPSPKLPAFYWATPRLISSLFGQPAFRAETNPVEAYGGSILIFLIPYLAGVQFFAPRGHGATALVMSGLLIFAVLIFWVLVFYFNSLVIKILRAGRLLMAGADRSVQDVLVRIVMAALAAYLALSGSWSRWLGLIVLTLITVDLLAAVLLQLTQPAPPPA
jgi:hypothetical protein